MREFEAMDITVLKKNAREFYQNRLRPEDNYRKLIAIYDDISVGAKERQTFG